MLVVDSAGVGVAGLPLYRLGIVERVGGRGRCVRVQHLEILNGKA